MAIFGSFDHCLPNILHTWPHDSFQVIQLSTTLSIFQGHWTLSHQISQKRCVIRQKLLWTTNGKSYTSFRLVPLLVTLKYIWRSLSLGCHFHVHFSYPWHAFASHGLPAIAELLVFLLWCNTVPVNSKTNRRSCRWCNEIQRCRSYSVKYITYSSTRRCPKNEN